MLTPKEWQYLCNKLYISSLVNPQTTGDEKYKTYVDNALKSFCANILDYDFEKQRFVNGADVCGEDLFNPDAYMLECYCYAYYKGEVKVSVTSADFDDSTGNNWFVDTGFMSQDAYFFVRFGLDDIYSPYAYLRADEIRHL